MPSEVHQLDRLTEMRSPSLLPSLIPQDGFIVDKDDSSVTRSDSYLREIFTRARLLPALPPRTQRAFPRELFAVRMYALKPAPHL